MNTLRTLRLPLFLAATLGFGSPANAEQAIQDTLTGASTVYRWVPLNGACLTAGDGTGTIPACVGLPYYAGKTLVGGTTGRLPDAVNSGALRLSNGDTTTNGSNGNNQTGSIVSDFTFGTKDGIQVTWTSVSYGGNNYRGTGADGIAFFLSDGAYPATIGAFGGSLGYSCANAKTPSDGVIGGYIGVGIDEFGNFSNPGDNTNTGPGFHPGRIAVRGAGFTAWDWLSKSTAYGKYYNGSANATAIQKTCASGYAYNYSGGAITDSTNVSIASGAQTHDKLPYNYPLLYSVDVPAGTSLANQQGINKPLRGSAIPIVFALKITSNGLLDFSYSANGGATQTVVTGLKITASNGPLPTSFRFGFSSGTGGGSNVHEITCFKAEPVDISNTSAGANVQQGQVVPGLAQVFLAFYHPVNWWGSITANALNYDTNTDTLTASTIATWDGGCVITGGACGSRSPDQQNPLSFPVQPPASRVVLSYSNSNGVAFQTGSLSNAQLALLGSKAADQQMEVDYLRGVRDNEQSSSSGTGTLRDRTSVLADIIDSSPVFVGAPTFNYANKFVDKLASSINQPEGTSYASFASNNASRMNMVYVGSNDGMLHGFRAGTLASDGKTLVNNDGQELLAYVPDQVISAIRPTASGSVGYDYSNPLYQHNFQVDATPGMGDLYYSGAWHTWLVTGLGVGGHPGGPVNSNGTDNSGNQLIPDPVGALFALDVTDPGSFSEASNAAKSTVIGEWNSSTLPKCIDNTTCGTNMGQVSGTPLIRRLHDGGWGVIWGNGLNSKTARAGIFIMHISSSGGRSFQYIDAGPGPANGIVNVTAADLDGDHITDYVYAGDVLGNLWRFDLTSSSAAAWSTAVKPIFAAPTNQPITTAPLVSAVPAPSSGLPKILVSFGTGQKLPLTSGAPEVYAAGIQSLYGVWDADMAGWNGQPSDAKYESMATPIQPVTNTSLATRLVNTVKGLDGNFYRVITPNPATKAVDVCWNGSTACGSGNTQMGWEVDLPGLNEQVVYNPVQVEDSFVVNTLIPTTNNILNCKTTPPTGFTMAPSLMNGGGDNAPFSDGKAKSDGTISSYSGLAANGSGTPTELNVGGQTHLGFETTDANWKGPKFNRKGGTVSRVTWTKVR